MKFGPQKVIRFDYTLSDNDGEVIDSTEGQEPLAFIYGSAALKPALREQMEGRQSGDSFQVTVQPEDGYGLRDESLIREVGRDMFGDIEQIEAGMLFQTANAGGATEMVTVVAVGDDTVTVDHNHPLAGVTLNFAIDVIEVRDATQEEISHGHVHGPGGHQH